MSQIPFLYYWSEIFKIFMPLFFSAGAGVGRRLRVTPSGAQGLLLTVLRTTPSGAVGTICGIRVSAQVSHMQGNARSARLAIFETAISVLRI